MKDREARKETFLENSESIWSEYFNVRVLLSFQKQDPLQGQDFQSRVH
jgi:hypothetical protein